MRDKFMSMAGQDAVLNEEEFSNFVAVMIKQHDIEPSSLYPRPWYQPTKKKVGGAEAMLRMRKDATNIFKMM